MRRLAGLTVAILTLVSFGLASEAAPEAVRPPHRPADSGVPGEAEMLPRDGGR